METTNYCVFCQKDTLQYRIIRTNKLCYSFVSNPWFRSGHCLVVPKRHLIRPSELNEDEAMEIMIELGRLSALLDDGAGTGMMQKYQPLQQENAFKQNHLHFHVFPRQKTEDQLFPVPEPNSFAGFCTPTKEDIEIWLKKLS